MNLPDARNLVKKELSRILKPDGYKYSNKNYGFIRKLNNGFCGIITGFVNHKPFYTLNMIFVIRIDEVEDIFNQFSSIVPGYQESSATIMVRYAYFKGVKEFRIEFSTETELVNALKEFEHIYAEQIKQFSDKYSTLENLYPLVEDGSIAGIDFSAAPDNFIHWLIIAKLCGAVNLGVKAKDFFSAYLARVTVESSIERVERFKAYLENK